jgi:hypothetical protein
MQLPARLLADLVGGDTQKPLRVLDADDRRRPPPTGGGDAGMALEMIQGVYASHFQRGARTAIPLKERRHPLGEV